MKYLRIKKNTHFQRLFKRGKRVFSPCLTLLYAPANKTGMGIAVSKKHGSAVKRNRIKRLLRESFRRNMDILNAPYDFVIIPKVAEEGKEFSLKDYDKSLNILFSKINAQDKKSKN